MEIERGGNIRGVTVHDEADSLVSSHLAMVVYHDAIGVVSLV